MAKIYKMSGYLVDPHGDNANDLIDDMIADITYGMELMPRHFHIDNAEFEWDDEHPLNYINCDLAHCEKYFSKDSTKGLNKRKVEVGGVYRHFKEGKYVDVIAVSQDAEYPGSYVVVYMNMEDGSIWHRPYDMFVSEIDREKYPNAKGKYRFEKVGRPMRIYLSGPITGTNNFHKRFEDAEKKIKKMNRDIEIVNPVKENAKLNTSCYEEIMENSLKLLGGCDAIYMMKNWHSSNGCNREYGYALGAGKDVLWEINDEVTA